jgi:hypothetical protein
MWVCLPGVAGGLEPLSAWVEAPPARVVRRLTMVVVVVLLLLTMMLLNSTLLPPLVRLALPCPRCHQEPSRLQSEVAEVAPPVATGLRHCQHSAVEVQHRSPRRRCSPSASPAAVGRTANSNATSRHRNASVRNGRTDASAFAQPTHLSPSLAVLVFTPARDR